MKRITIMCVLVTLLGCTSFVSSVTGTFVGNIASDKVLKEINKKDTHE